VEKTAFTAFTAGSKVAIFCEFRREVCVHCVNASEPFVHVRALVHKAPFASVHNTGL
jgi:hypothetical protein